MVKMYNKKQIKHYLLMMAPGFVWLILFSIVPMFGIVMAFQDFDPTLGLFRSEWVGWDNFQYMFAMKDVRQVFENTIVIAALKMIGNLLIPLIFALMLNGLAYKRLVRPIQTVTYLPYFLSWVILAGVVLNIFSYTGPVNRMLAGIFGTQPVLFFGRPDLFRQLVVGTDVWKNFGYNAVIYFAALTGIDPALHEAATIDGAGRFQRLRYITLPGIKSTVVLLAILSLGNVLNAGFDQIFNLYNPLVYSTGDIIDTWVYRAGLQNLQFSLATAVGLLKSVVSFVLITASYYLADRFAGYRIF
jgi:putative aldouronate transport system permease protein